VARLETDLGERIRERGLPTAPASNRISNLLEDLSPDDIAEEPAGHIVRLAARAEYLEGALALVRDAVRDGLHADLKELGERLAASARQAEERLAALTQSPAPLRPTVPDEGESWDAVRKMVHLDFQYQAESPRRGFFDLIMHGRRPVVILTMILSLFGAAFGAGHGLMGKLAPLLLLIFLGSLLWGFLEFRHERHERIDRELRRMREMLGNGLRRLYDQVLREWQTRAARALRVAHKELDRQIEDRLRAHQAQWGRTAEQERREAQDRLKVLEQRQRDLAGLGQQIQRLRQSALEAGGVLERAAKERCQESGVRSQTGSAP
jgi:hypothetical protein